MDTDSASPCGYEVSESASFTPLVHDTDPALFPGAGSDARPGAIYSPGRRIFVAGTRTVALAQDGKRYSRALEANTVHYYRVTCGSDVVTGQFATANPPLGNSYPELPPFDAAAFGNLADPTIDWSDKSVAYIDPLTGIRLQRVTGPGDNGALVPKAPFDYSLSVNGALFLSWNQIRDYQLTWGGANLNPSQGTVDDLAVDFTGMGQNAPVSVCISLDSGQTCASHSLQVQLTGDVDSQPVRVPANYPSPLFAGWGRAFSIWDIANAGGSGASFGGTQTVTAPEGSFNTDWPAGIKIKFTGSGCNGNDICTLASVQSSAQLTTVETLSQSFQNQPWQSYGAGVRIEGISGPADSLGASYEYAESRQTMMADNPSVDYCSALTVDDIYTDKDGNPLATPESGRLCNFGTGLYLAVNGTGEFRLLSNYVMNSNAPSPGAIVQVPVAESFSETDPKTFYGTIAYTRGLYQGVYTGDYTTYKAGPNGYISNAPKDDSVVWTAVMQPGSPADPAVQFPTYPGMSFYDPALFSAPSFNAFLGGYADFWAGPFSGVDTICVVIRYSLDTHQIVQALPSWPTWPLRWGGCHFSPQGAGSFQIAGFNALNGGNAGWPLNGPFQLAVTQVRKGGTWSNNTALSESVVDTASNTSPVVITTAGTYTDAGTFASMDHGLIDGEPVVIWGEISNTAINTPPDQTYFVKASWSDTDLAAPLDAASTTIPVVDASRMMANPMLRIDSELIRCSAISGNSLTGCVRGSAGTTPAVHASGAAVSQANSFALYHDKDLTQPVAGNGDFSGTRTAFVMDLDQCPAGLDPRWTTNMFFDDSGASGFRCSTIRVNGEPHSNYAYWTSFSPGSGLQSIVVADGIATIQLSSAFSAWKSGQSITIGGAAASALNGTFPITSLPSQSTAIIQAPGVPDGTYTESSLTVRHPTEHYAYPFQGDPSNLNTSSLQDIQEGDFIHDMYSLYTGEQMVVVRKVKNSDTDIELTIMRFWGNQTGCDRHLIDSSPQLHRDGWIPFMVPSYGCPAARAYADIGDSTWSIADYRYAEEHGDIGSGDGPGLFTYVSSGSATPISNEPFSQLMTTPATYGDNEYPLFAGSTGALPYNGTTQAYGAFRQSTAPPSEKVWKADFHALNSYFGAAQDIPVGLTPGMSLANISGTNYDPSGQTAHVYRVTAMPSGLDRKRLPLLGFSGYHYFADKSGPDSLITDDDAYHFCVADFAGECRPGSNGEDVFVTLPAPDPNNNWCVTDTYETNVPCLFSANSVGGWAVQWQIDPPDTTAQHGRRLTMGFVNPGRHFTFANWDPSPDAQWGFLSPPWINGVRNDIFAMKLPPWPAGDGIDRTNFVPLTVNVPALPGAVAARARFGYAENGPAGQFYCTTRQEACTTAGAPFAWLSEPQQPQSCNDGCMLEINAIAGRVVYYQIDWLDGAGNVLSSGPMAAAVAAP